MNPNKITRDNKPVKGKTCLRYSEDNWPDAKTIGGEPWPAPDETLPHRGGKSCECKTCTPPPRVVQLAPGVPMPDLTSATWPHVFAFACAMEHKLSKNRLKGDPAGWRKDGAAKLQDRLDDEIEELNGALWHAKTPDKGAVLLEAADVANFAMMIADCVQHER